MVMTTEEWINTQLARAPKLTPASQQATLARVRTATERARKDGDDNADAA